MIDMMSIRLLQRQLALNKVIIRELEYRVIREQIEHSPRPDKEYIAFLKKLIVKYAELQKHIKLDIKKLSGVQRVIARFKAGKVTYTVNYE
jgi:hypothetical protein